MGRGAPGPPREAYYTRRRVGERTGSGPQQARAFTTRLVSSMCQQRCVANSAWQSAQGRRADLHHHASPAACPHRRRAHGTWPRGLSPIAGGPSHLEQLSTGARAVGLSLQASHPQHYVHQGDALEGRRRVGLAFEGADLILVRVRVGVGVRVGARFGARVRARVGLG